MARTFNGSSDFITNTSIPVAFNTNGAAYTLAAWINTTTLDSPGVVREIIAFNGLSNVPGELRLMMQNIGSGPVVFAFIRTGSGGDLVAQTGPTLLSTNTWYHTASIFTLTTASTGAAIVDTYLNAGDHGTNSGSNVNYNSGASNGVQIGAILSGNNFWSGRLADCAVWNVALTVNELQALSQGLRPIQIRPKNLVGYWPLDGLVSPEPDLAGGKWNGTLTGTTYGNGPPLTTFTPRWPLVLPPPPPPPASFLFAQACL